MCYILNFVSIRNLGKNPKQTPHNKHNIVYTLITFISIISSPVACNLFLFLMSHFFINVRCSIHLSFLSSNHTHKHTLTSINMTMKFNSSPNASIKFLYHANEIHSTFTLLVYKTHMYTHDLYTRVYKTHTRLNTHLGFFLSISLSWAIYFFLFFVLKKAKLFK